MKKIILSLCSLLVLSFMTNCSDKTTTTDTNGANQNQPVVTADNSSSVSELNETVSKQLFGLWKLQKTISNNGTEYIESENKSIEKKNDGTFIDNKGNGTWYLSFRAISNELTETLFTTDRDHGFPSNKTFSLSFVNENNVNYLKLLDLRDGETFFCIRQH